VERTESRVVQVAPDWENQKIEEMQQFGWSLQNRQEIEQEGEAYGRPSHMAEFTGTYVIKTMVSRFVKLHFVRSLSMANLDEIRQLEAAYEALPFPGKVSYKGPGCLTAFFAVGYIPALQKLSAGRVSEGLLLVLGYSLIVGAGLFWLSRRHRKNRDAEQSCRRSAGEAQSLMQRSRALMG
jgi:hypothetical protein